jgi:ADP-ribose pyrophosphatase
VILIPLVYGPEIFGPGVFGPERGPAVLFVRQVRVALGVPCLELPAGTLERGENPFGCAARELIEETGYQAATVRTLGRFYTSPGLSDELMHAFVASDLTHVGQAMEDDEDIEVVPLPLHEVWRMVQAGELMDGKSITALALAAAQGHIPGWSEVGSHGR